MMHSTDPEKEQQVADELIEYLSHLEQGTAGHDGPPREGPTSHLREIVDDLYWASNALDSADRKRPRLGKFEIERSLGSGGQSETFLAWDDELQRQVVLKIYPLGDRPKAVQAVLREGRLLSRVDSPYVVKCLSVESFDSYPSPSPSSEQLCLPGLTEPAPKNAEAQQYPYLVLEYIDGTPLDVLLRLNPMGADEIRKLMTQLGQGLACVHAAGLIHRDIKPGNIIVSATGEPKLIDFGLTVTSGDEGLEPGSGTVAYMSPEQAQRQDELDHRTDIFGLGAVMYHLLTGFPLYRATTKDETRELAKTGKVDEISKLNPGADRTLAKVCRKCLQTTPEQRYQSADDLLAALTQSKRNLVPLGLGTLLLVCALGWLVRAWNQPTAADPVEILSVEVQGGAQNEQGVFEFQVDDAVHLAVTVRQSGFLRVWSQEGDVYRQLFPNAAQPDRRLNPGETVVVPDPERALLKLTASQETEFFRVVVSDDQLPVLRGDSQGYFITSSSAEEQSRLNSELRQRLDSISRGAEVALLGNAPSDQGKVVAEKFIPFRVMATPLPVAATRPTSSRTAAIRSRYRRFMRSPAPTHYSDQLRQGRVHYQGRMYDTEALSEIALKIQRLRAEGRWQAAADSVAPLLADIYHKPAFDQVRRATERFVADTLDVAGYCAQAVELREQILARFDNTHFCDPIRRELEVELQMSEALSAPELLANVREVDQRFHQFVLEISSNPQQAQLRIDECLSLEEELPAPYREYLLSQAVYWRGVWRCEQDQMEGGRQDLSRALAFCESGFDYYYNQVAAAWNSRVVPIEQLPSQRLAMKSISIVLRPKNENVQVARESYEYLGQRAKVLTDMSIAHKLMGKGDLVRAEGVLREVLQLAERNYGPASIFTIDIRKQLARILLASGRKEEASSICQKNWKAIYKVQRTSIGTDSPAAYSSFLATNLGTWISTLDLQNPENARRAYDAIWRSRWFVESVMIRAAQKSFPDGLRPSYDELVKLKHQSVSDLVSASHQLTTTVLRNGADPAEEQRQRNAQVQQILQSLSASNADYREAIALSQTTIDDLAKLMSPQVGIVELFKPIPLVPIHRFDGTNRGRIQPPRYGAFVIKSDGSAPNIQWVDLGPSQSLDRAAQEWFHVCEEGRFGPELKSAHELRKQVWEPLRPALEGLESIVVIPCGRLSGLPWCSLPIDDQGGHLIDRLEVSYASSGQELLHVLRQPEVQADGMLVVGGIDYGRWESTRPDLAGHRSASVEFQGVASGSDKPHPSWNRLPGSHLEASTIAHRYDAAKVTLLSGEAATEDHITNTMTGQRYVHLATHGYYRAPPPLNRQNMQQRATDSTARRVAANRSGDFYFDEFEWNGLVLAGANRRPSDSLPTSQDGILSGNEVANLSLPDTELVVLSACETAAGSVSTAGVLGLQRAFHIAGARAVVASQWKVDDQLTQVFMKRYYENLLERGMGKQASLRDAQLALRNGELTDGKGQPPAAWAGWVLSGDFR